MCFLINLFEIATATSSLPFLAICVARSGLSLTRLAAFVSSCLLLRILYNWRTLSLTRGGTLGSSIIVWLKPLTLYPRGINGDSGWSDFDVWATFFVYRDFGPIIWEIHLASEGLGGFGCPPH